MRQAGQTLLTGATGFVGSAHATTTPINCATAKTLTHSKVRPVWFPSPLPPGRFVLNAEVPMFGPGLEWSSGQRYIFLGRVPGGANLGAPFPTRVEEPYLANFNRRLQVYRLAKVEGGRLYTEWPTFSRYPDMTYTVADGETLSQFVSFLRSLRELAWPTGCR